MFYLNNTKSQFLFQNYYKGSVESDKAESEPFENEQKDYISHYQEFEEVEPKEEVPKHTYDFELDSSAASGDENVEEEEESEPVVSKPPLSTMAELAEDGKTKDVS